MRRNSTQSIGPYPVLKRVSTGGVANLYLARDPSSNPGDGSVAVRVLSSTVSEDELLCRILQEQVTIALGFSNSNVAPVLSWNKEGSRLYIARPWIEGMDLESLSGAIRQRAGLDFPLLQALYVVREAAKALAYIHDSTPHGRAVHRGVTPRNLILKTDGSVILTDFGMWPVTWRNAMSISGWGQRRLPYLSPEEAALQIGLDDGGADGVGPAADVFALGACLHSLVHGTDVYGMSRGTLSPLKALNGVRNWGGWKPPAETESRVPVQLHRLLYRLLARDPVDRPQNGAEAAESIGKCLAQFVGEDDSEIAEELGGLISMAQKNMPTTGAVDPAKESGRADAGQGAEYPTSDTEVTGRVSSEGRTRVDPTAVSPLVSPDERTALDVVPALAVSDETLVDVSPPFTANAVRDLEHPTLDSTRVELASESRQVTEEGGVRIRNANLRRVDAGSGGGERNWGPMRSATQLGSARKLLAEHSQWNRQIPRVRAPLPPIHGSWTFRFLLIAVMVLAMLCVVLVHLAREKDKASGQLSILPAASASVSGDVQTR